MDHHWMYKYFGMQTLVDLSNSPMCEDKCTSLYKRFVEQYDKKLNPGLSDKVMNTLENMIAKFQTLNPPQEDAKKLKLFSTFALSLVKCAREDPATCPYEPKILKGFIEAIHFLSMGHHKHMSKQWGKGMMMLKGMKNKRGKNNKKQGNKGKKIRTSRQAWKDSTEEYEWYEDGAAKNWGGNKGKGKNGGKKGSHHSGDGEYEYEWEEEWSQGGGGKKGSKGGKKGKSGNKGSHHSGDGEYEYEWNEEWSKGGGGNKGSKGGKKGKSGNKGSQHSGDGEYEYEWNEEWSQGGGGKKGGKGGKGKGGHGKGSKSCCQAIDLIMETDFGFGGNQGLYKYNGTINGRGYWIMENKNTAKWGKKAMWYKDGYWHIGGEDLLGGKDSWSISSLMNENSKCPTDEDLEWEYLKQNEWKPTSDMYFHCIGIYNSVCV